MKEFRVAPCLVDGEVHEYAIFKDGSRNKRIYIDDDYGKYFYVDNELNTDLTTALRHSFNNRIKDAVDMIRNGNGDCISQKQIAGVMVSDNVVYFLDRSIGEQLRNRSIEGWKDAKFAWAIKCYYIQSFAPGLLLDKSGSMSFGPSDIMTFETKEDAKSYMDNILDKAAEYVKKINNSMTENKDEDDEIFNSIIDEIDEYTGTTDSVIKEFVFDMISDDCKSSKNDFKLVNMNYRIVQHLC